MLLLAHFCGPETASELSFRNSVDRIAATKPPIDSKVQRTSLSEYRPPPPFSEVILRPFDERRFLDLLTTLQDDPDEHIALPLRLLDTEQWWREATTYGFTDRQGEYPGT